MASVSSESSFSRSDTIDVYQFLIAANNPIRLAEVSLEQAIKKAKSKYGGKVLSAKQIESKGPLVYKIKLLLPNGRVKTVFVDGSSGDVFEA
ncbi:MAG: PepSY domain-containing protein [Pseudomonadales bacterium]|nr:PepSY domain-containing protein [Pseudomonadales bacterium]